MSRPALVYKTDSPKILAWWKDAQQRQHAVRDLRNAYIVRLTEEFGPIGKRYEVGAEELDIRPIMRNRSDQIFGVGCKSGEQPPKGSGWRLDAHSGYWMPDLRSKVGKERAAELKGLDGVDLRSEAGEFGVPGDAFDEHAHRLYSPGLTFRDDPQYLYVTWGSDACSSEMERSAVEGITWVAVPLSEWHAWREQAEAQAAAQGAVS